MAKALVIVESPTKARTINKFLGADYLVEASGGHIMDLPRKKMGVDIKNNFCPEYVIIAARQKLVSQLKKEAKDKGIVYLAADPDREGEAICWHLKQNLEQNTKIYRVIFHEITEEKVKEAFAHPGSIDMRKVQAQQARRVLDRLVGYNLSPLLWKKVSRGLSAGRVQSVAVRLIVEREREIGHFIPQEYWGVEAQLKKRQTQQPFVAKLDKISGKNPQINNKEEADKILAQIGKEKFIVSDIQQKEKKRSPNPPYTTSKLQQDAFNQLHFPAAKTMRIAQQLYEGIELGMVGSVGLITYMRTDSVKVSQQAQTACRDYIERCFGKEFLPLKPYQYKSKRLAQEAHEAIRPTLPLRPPKAIQEYLNPDQFKLYALIWNKFLASQMRPAVYKIDTVLIIAGEFLFKAVASTLEFAGFLKVFAGAKKAPEEEERQSLPVLKIGEELDLVKLDSHQHFTQSPPRFNDASLVKALEEKGIGRPSTYAPIIQTIVFRDYVRRKKSYLFPTELGFTVTDILIKYFPKILNVKFTAILEDDLDKIEEGELNWVEVVRLLYEPFQKELIVAQKKIKKEVILTKEVCELCGRPMVMKWGRHGRFLSCAGFPECRNARSITTEVRCPQQNCTGWLVERRTKRGKVFYGCSNYPNCKYAANKLPEVETEPEAEQNVK